MSKLFEAISNLEADTGQAVIDSPFRTGHSGAPSEPGNENKVKKTLVLAAGILILALSGGSGVLYLSKRLATSGNTGHWSSFSQKPLATGHAQKETLTLKRENRPVSEHKLPGAIPGSTSKDLNTAKASLKRQLEEIQEKHAGQASLEPDHLKRPDSALAKTNKLPPLKNKFQPQAKGLMPFVSNPLILDSHQKRLLYRAEKLRKNGNQAEALAIYKRIWQQTKNPMVANNLAAILMEKEKFREALNVLEQAVKISPKDQDLQYNLSQLQQFLKKPQRTTR